VLITQVLGVDDVRQEVEVFILANIAVDEKHAMVRILELLEQLVLVKVFI